MPDEKVNVIGGPRCSPDRDRHAPDETELDPVLRGFLLRLSHSGQEFPVPHGRLSAFSRAKACPRSSACFMRWPAPCSRLATNVAPSDGKDIELKLQEKGLTHLLVREELLGRFLANNLTSEQS